MTREDDMDIEEGRAAIEAELMYGARKLRRAKKVGDKMRVGYWRAYVESRERFLLMLDSMYDDPDA